MEPTDSHHCDKRRNQQRYLAACCVDEALIVTISVRCHGNLHERVAWEAHSSGAGLPLIQGPHRPPTCELDFSLRWQAKSNRKAQMANCHFKPAGFRRLASFWS